MLCVTITNRNWAWLSANPLYELPATPKAARTATRLVTRLRAEGGHGEILRTRLTDSKQEATVIDTIQRERTDGYHEVVQSTRLFDEELQF
jgi:hypothetical protein